MSAREWMKPIPLERKWLLNSSDWNARPPSETNFSEHLYAATIYNLFNILIDIQWPQLYLRLKNQLSCPLIHAFYKVTTALPNTGLELSFIKIYVTILLIEL